MKWLERGEKERDKKEKWGEGQKDILMMDKMIMKKI